MCLVGLAYRASGHFPLIIAANRDEFLDRPTAALRLWQSPKGMPICSGQDLRDGGTWMGFTPSGRFAMLTNVRRSSSVVPREPISRGQLVLSWLESAQPAERWIDQLNLQRYQGFNLIVGDWPAQQCVYLPHGASADDLEPFEGPNTAMAGKEYSVLAIKNRAYDLQPGHVFGLSNAALDTPWPKTQRLKTGLERTLHQASDTQISNELMAALSDDRTAADDELPQTGVPSSWEKALSSPFVAHQSITPDGTRYGTRSSLVALLDRQGHLNVQEYTYSSQLDRTGCVQMSEPRLSSTSLLW